MSINDILAETKPLWSLVLFACSLLFGTRPLRTKIREQLEDPASRSQYSAELKEERFFPGLDGRRYGEQDYRRRLRKILARIDYIFGERLLFNIRGGLVCIGCALVYSSFFLLLGWLLGLGASTNSLDVLPSDWEWWRRSILILILALEAVITCRMSLASFRKNSRLRSFLCWAGVFFVAYIAIFLALALSTGEFHLFRSSMDHYSFAILLFTYCAAFLGCFIAGIVNRSRTLVLGILLLAMIGLSLAGIVMDDLYTSHDQFVMLFIFVLPIVNALLDWPSWAISRKLIAILAARPSPLSRLTGHIFVDLAAALTLSLALAAVLPAIMMQTPLGIPVITLIDSARADPLGKGLWMLLMLLSTIVPTFIHIIAVLASALVCRLPESLRLRQVEKLELVDAPSESTQVPYSKRDLDDVANFLTLRWAYAGLVLLILMVVLWMPFLIGARPIGHLLGQVAAASAVCTVSPKGAQNRAGVLLGLTQDAIYSGNNKAALQLATSVLELELSNGLYYAISGSYLNELNQYGKALDAIKQGLKVEQDNSELHYSHGRILHNLERYDEALLSLDRAHELGVDSAIFHFARSSTLHRLKRYDEALLSLDRAHELGVDGAKFHYNHGSILHELKRYEEATKESKLAIDLEPDIAIFHDGLANTLQKLKLYTEAVDAMKRALELEPDNAVFHYNLGVSLHELARFEEALNEKRQALKLEPSNALFHNSLGATLHALKRYEEALVSMEKAVDLEPSSSFFINGLDSTRKALKCEEDSP